MMVWSDLAEMRRWYCERAATWHMEHGRRYQDLALSLPGARYLRAVLDRYKPLRVVELGAGFSTLVIGDWRRDRLAPVYVTVDNDAAWLAEVRAMSVKAFGEDEATLCRHWETPDVARRHRHDGIDLVLVDHGPTMETRLADVPWIIGMLRPGGLALFDDCRNTTRFRHQLAKELLPFKTGLVMTRSSRGDGGRWIGVARKPRSGR